MRNVKLFMLMTVGFTFILNSCSTISDNEYRKLFEASTFKHEKREQVSRSEKKVEEKRVTVSFADISVFDFSIWFSTNFNKGIVFSEAVRRKKLTAEFSSATESEVVSILAKSLELDSNLLGNTYYVGEFSEADRGVLVRYMPTYSVDTLTSSVKSFTGEKGRFYVTPECVVIVADRESVLSRVSSLLDDMTRITHKRYLVSYYILDLDFTAMKQKGVDITTTGDFGATLNMNNFTDALATLQNVTHSVKFDITGYARYVAEEDFGKIVSTPVFLCFDNIMAESSRGEVIPIVKRNISSEGTVSEDYDEREIGQILKTLVRPYSRAGEVILHLDYADSSVLDFINDEVPRYRQDKFKTSAVLKVGKLYLLGEFISQYNKHSVRGFLSDTKKKRAVKTQIFVKVTEV